MLPSGPVTFPKLVVHAALAGIYGGCVVAILVVLANPPGAAAGGGRPAIGMVVVLAYAFAAAVVWPVLYAALRFFASHRLRLTWLSLRYLVGFHAVNTGAILAAGWALLSEYRAALSPRAADRMALACGCLSAAWLAAVVVAIVPGLRRRAWPQAAAGGIALAALLSALPGGAEEARPPGAGSPPAAAPVRRLVLLNFDGADLDTILTMQAQGKLPAFSRLVEEGAYGRLASVVPCAASVTRTTLVTGMLPFRHGVRSAEVRRMPGGGPALALVPPGIGFDVLLSPLLERRAVSVADRRAPALWDISALLGGRGVAAGWEIDLDARAGRAGAAAPQDWMADLVDPEVLRSKDAPARALVGVLSRAAAADAAVLEALERFETDPGGGVVALSFPGLDRVSHVFLRYARPAEFGNVSARDIDLYGPVLERYYRRIDGLVGRALQAEGPRAAVLVTATHGIEPAPALRRLRDEVLHGEHLSGVHEDAPPGFLFVHGPDTQRGRVFGKGSIADVAPTALYALGLPVARDAHGSILAGVFSEAYTATHPVTVIGSYGGH